MIKISIEVNKNCETLATELLKKIQPKQNAIYSVDKDGRIGKPHFVRKED